MKIFVLAKPASHEDLIEKIDETHFVIKVKEPPVGGRANRAIIKLLAKYFDTPPSRIQIISGFASKQKIINIQKQ